MLSEAYFSLTFHFFPSSSSSSFSSSSSSSFSLLERFTSEDDDHGDTGREHGGDNDGDGGDDDGDRDGNEVIELEIENAPQVPSRVPGQPQVTSPISCTPPPRRPPKVTNDGVTL
jgi:hypothetical protein